MATLTRVFIMAVAGLVIAPSALAQDAAMLRFDARNTHRAAVNPDLQRPLGEVIYDTLWITDEGAANAGVGNAIGGARAFKSLGTIDSQFADDFHLDSAMHITTVIVDCQSFFDTDAPDEGLWIQFYADDGVRPSEDLHADVIVTSYTREFKGVFANRETYRYTLDFADANIVLDAGDWWMDVQPLDIADGGWFWSLSVLDFDPPEGDFAHVRDGWEAHGNNYFGLWNSTVWIEHDFRGRAMPARRIEGMTVGGPRLALRGSCPGEMTLDLSGATSNGVVAILFGLQTGSFTIPSGPCQGTVLGLSSQGLRILATTNANSNGALSITRNVGTAACGRYLQAVDGATCATTNVVEIN